MLMEIECDEFISYGKPRGKIKFHSGLNTILGIGRSDNSVGKSTFLLVIDFCFGGDTLWKNTKLTDMVQQHDIKFMFQFDTKYYFKRSPYKPSIVWICDENYKEQEEQTVDDLKVFLYGKYNLEFDSENDFRNIVSRYFRVEDKGNCNHNYPLQLFPAESNTKGIDALVKTFNKYRILQSAQEAKNKADADKKAVTELKKTGIFNIHIPAKEKRDENITELIRLRRQRADLLEEADYFISEEEMKQTEKSLEIYREINRQKRRRRHLIARQKAAKQNLEYDNQASFENIEQLQNYFDGVNFERIYRIQDYHNKLGTILRTELQEEVDVLNTCIKELTASITSLEEMQRGLGKPVNISQEKLDELSDLNREIARLEEENRLYDENKKYEAEVREKNKALKITQATVYGGITTAVNNELEVLNEIVDDTKHPIKFAVYKSDSYELTDGYDEGMGRGFVGMAMYDLAIIRTTSVPALAHDTSIFNNMGTDPIEKILRLYSKSDKQIFIAYDKQDRVADDVGKILEDTTVIKLSKGGNELYGGPWANREAKL